MKKIILKYIIIKLLTTSEKEKILKSATGRKKDIMSVGPKIRITADFSTEKCKLQDSGTTSLTC